MVFLVVTREMAGDQKINTIQHGESENAAICRVLQTVEANEDSRFLKTLAGDLIELKVIIINNCHPVILDICADFSTQVHAAFGSKRQHDSENIEKYCKYLYFSSFIT